LDFGLVPLWDKPWGFIPLPHPSTKEKEWIS